MSVIRGTVTPKNIQKMCKICLKEKNELIPFDSIIQIEDTNIASITITDILKKVISQVATTENCNPKVMCPECLNELTIAYLFVLKYEEADKILKEGFLSNPLKKEDEKLDFDETAKERPKSFKKGHKSKTFGDDETSTRSILYPCPICTGTFKALELRAHVHTHKALKRYLNIPSAKKVSPGTRFSTKRHLERPQETIFKKLEKLHKCPYCDFEFPANEFRVHVNAHDGTRDEFKCDQCGKAFKKLRCLNNHRVIHLQEFPYKCQTCGKGFVIKTNYDYHILSHASDKSPLECPYCLKKFTNPRNHHRHSKIHEKVTVYKCYYCRKTFPDHDQLKRHVCVPPTRKFPAKTRPRVPKQTISPHKTLCYICGKRVLQWKIHMLSHSDEKPFRCNQCNKTFRMKSHLNRHFLVHSGVKAYVCSGCGKAFNNLQNLEVHEKTHNGVKRHFCTICNRGFLVKAYLKRHMKVHSTNLIGPGWKNTPINGRRLVSLVEAVRPRP